MALPDQSTLIGQSWNQLADETKYAIALGLGAVLGQTMDEIDPDARAWLDAGFLDVSGFIDQINAMNADRDPVKPRLQPRQTLGGKWVLCCDCLTDIDSYSDYFAYTQNAPFTVVTAADWPVAPPPWLPSQVQ